MGRHRATKTLLRDLNLFPLCPSPSCSEKVTCRHSSKHSVILSNASGQPEACAVTDGQKTPSIPELRKWNKVQPVRRQRSTSTAGHGAHDIVQDGFIPGDGRQELSLSSTVLRSPSTASSFMSPESVFLTLTVLFAATIFDVFCCLRNSVPTVCRSRRSRVHCQIHPRVRPSKAKQKSQRVYSLAEFLQTPTHKAFGASEHAHSGLHMASATLHDEQVAHVSLPYELSTGVTLLPRGTTCHWDDWRFPYGYTNFERRRECL